MKNIPFTQFMRPDGHRKTTAIERPDQVADKALELIDKKGWSFECEVLTNGQVSLTVEDHSAEDDPTIAIIVSDNDEAIPSKVDTLVERAYETWKERHAVQE